MKFYFFIGFFISSIECFAQSLLLNGSFEEENICTEYHINCAPEGWICTFNGYSNYFKDPKLAYHGSHCMAIQAGHAKQRYNRTFIRSQLVCALRKENMYRIQFFVKSRHSILDSIGIYFSSVDFLFEKKLPHTIVPTLYLCKAAKKPVAKDSSWQQIVVEYKATGKEAFITIGNFSKRDITGPTGLGMESNYFVLIDGVSLTPINPEERICEDWKEVRDAIYDQNERHEWLTRQIQYYRNKPPPAPKLTLTFIPVIDTLIVPDVLFATASSQLSASGHRLLDSLATIFKKIKIDSLIMEGHTDSTGNVTRNEALSLARAESVAAYLQSKIDLSAVPIFVEGFASRRPVADNRTTHGRQMNRRVEIILYKKE